MVNKAEYNKAGHLVPYTSHLLGTLPDRKNVEARDVGHFLKHQLPNGRWILIKATQAMVGRTVEEAVARERSRKLKRRVEFSLRFTKKVSARDERPSIKLVMQFIADASPHELDAVLSKIISTPTGQTAVAKAAAAIGQAIDAPEDDGEVNPAVISAAGEMLTSQQVAERLKKTRQGVNEMLKRGAILGIRHGTHWRFPSAQFNRTAPVTGLTPLLRTLAHLDPWDALSIILAPEADRAQRPLELLKQGERAKAIAIASRKVADLKPLSSADRVMNALSADMAAEDEADRTAGGFAEQNVSQANV